MELWGPSSSLSFLLQVHYRLQSKPADVILPMVALLYCNLVCISLLTCLWADDAGATAPVGERDTSAFFPPFEEHTSCMDSQKLEAVVQLNPGLHDAPRHDSWCFMRTFSSHHQSELQPGSGKANSLKVSTSARCSYTSCCFWKGMG